LLETSLMVPLAFFLFLGMTDFGFYVYAFITTGNAARVAAQYTNNTGGVGQSTVACGVVLREMQSLPNVSPLSACNDPLTVVATQYTDSNGELASQVAVTYTTIQLFPLPFMAGKMTLTRTARMRLMD
jgi:hypothetical protein